MNANDLLKYARVITLAKRPERAVAFAERFVKSTGKSTRFSLGFDGQKLPIPSGWQTSNGAFGALLAHVATWARTLSDDTFDDDAPLTFFEDDAVFCERFVEKLDAVAALVPNDWELLYLGGEHLTGRPAPTVIASSVVGAGSVVQIVRAVNVNRLHAYAVKARAFKKIFPRLLAYLSNAPKRSGPSGDETCFDYEFGRMTEEGAVVTYAANPFLVGQGGFGSDTYPKTANDVSDVRFWN